MEGEDPPFTLAHENREIGAFQFSVARFKAGPVPNPSARTLLEMAEELAVRRGLTDLRDRITEGGVIRIGAISCHDDDYFIRLWYVSDGKHFMSATYTCELGLESVELAECEAILRTVRAL
jgi:hypothetical protein